MWKLRVLVTFRNLLRIVNKIVLITSLRRLVFSPNAQISVPALAGSDCICLLWGTWGTCFIVLISTKDVGVLQKPIASVLGSLGQQRLPLQLQDNLVFSTFPNKLYCRNLGRSKTKNHILFRRLLRSMMSLRQHGPCPD